MLQLMRSTAQSIKVVMFLALDQPMPLALMRWTVATVTTLGARQLTTPEECRLLTFTRCRICHVPASQPVKHPSDHALFDRTSPKSYQPCTAFLKKRSFFHITRAKTFLVVVANKKYIGSIRP